MSASLVGSEMCIRDSPALHQRAGGGCAQSSLPPPRPDAVGGGAEQRRGRCLLYTSDAADDM
eukprot:95492-Alexandrium_andersonii.AAC.1